VTDSDDTVWRLIPARAGTTTRHPSRGRGAPAHPRACGDHWMSLNPWSLPSGSSPRVRGPREPERLPPVVERLIPARAGTTPCRAHQQPRRAAHPRACGDHGSFTRVKTWLYGSSPRVRGPRGDRPRGAARPRLIPARAGTTVRARRKGSRSPAHPRACGDHGNRCRDSGGHCGSSPRVRGPPSDSHSRVAGMRLIPARAGTTPHGASVALSDAAHPRACGDHPDWTRAIAPTAGSSPRVRGPPRSSPSPRDPRRLIPARAGTTPARPARPPARAAHPRACGDHSSSGVKTWGMIGSSPRVRGPRAARASAPG